MRRCSLTAFLAITLGVACSVPANEGESGSQRGRTVKTATKGKADSTKDTATSDESGKTPKAKVTLEKATFGGGCFWCIEAVFEHVKGVKSVVSGYAGGSVPRPYYELVGTGQTGHAEVVQVEYDSSVVTYDELLKIFWSAHDPTTPNRQGVDEGTQYRSIILYHNDEQKESAQKMYEKLTAARAFRSPIVTELAPLTRFYPAERYHQNYYRNHRFDPYCEENITPKLQMLKYKQAMERAAEKAEKPASDKE